MFCEIHQYEAGRAETIEGNLRRGLLGTDFFGADSTPSLDDLLQDAPAEGAGNPLLDEGLPWNVIRPTTPGRGSSRRAGGARRALGFAQAELGDIAWIELPPVGSHLARGETACAIESLKSAGEVYAPVSGTVVSVNPALADEAGRSGDQP